MQLSAYVRRHITAAGGTKGIHKTVCYHSITMQFSTP